MQKRGPTKIFARIGSKRVPNTMTHPSTNLTNLQNSDPESTIHLQTNLQTFNRNRFGEKFASGNANNGERRVCACSFLALRGRFRAPFRAELVRKGSQNNFRASCLQIVRKGYAKTRPKQTFARIGSTRVPKTMTHPSTNLTNLQNSDPKSTIHLRRIIKHAIGIDSGKKVGSRNANNGERRVCACSFSALRGRFRAPFRAELVRNGGLKIMFLGILFTK